MSLILVPVDWNTKLENSSFSPPHLFDALLRGGRENQLEFLEKHILQKLDVWGYCMVNIA